MSLMPLPDNEAERLASLRNLNILDTPAEDRFDRLTRLGCRLLRAPFAMLTLIDHSRQWFKSACGHLLNEAPRAASFCTHTILQAQPMVVEDALQDQRFFDMPVVQDLGVRFYAGIPIFSQERLALGTFCILDQEPRQLDPEDLNALQDLAACAESEIQLVRSTQSERELLKEIDQVRLQAAVDPLTRCWNQETVLTLVGKEHEACRRLGTTLSLCVVNLHGLDDINKRWGQPVGDGVLREVCDRVRTALRPGDLLGRLTGPRFLLLTHAPLSQVEAQANSIVHAVVYRVVAVPDQYLTLTVTIGVAPLRGGPQETLARAEKAERSLQARGGSGVSLSV